MTEKRSSERKQIKRHSLISERHCSLRAVSCRTFTCTDQYVKIVDLSIIGIGVECDQPMDPGIIWFKESVYGQKWGHLVWQRKNGNRYRAGIEFISLSRLEEDYIIQRLEQGENGRAIQDPEAIISRVITSAINEREPAVNLV
jgi:hypothetical protein